MYELGLGIVGMFDDWYEQEGRGHLLALLFGKEAM
jgi:hypothetical protein